jgi:hypothetical protein
MKYIYADPQGADYAKLAALYGAYEVAADSAGARETRENFIRDIVQLENKLQNRRDYFRDEAVNLQAQKRFYNFKIEHRPYIDFLELEEKRRDQEALAEIKNRLAEIEEARAKVRERFSAPVPIPHDLPRCDSVIIPPKPDQRKYI